MKQFIPYIIIGMLIGGGLVWFLKPEKELVSSQTTTTHTEQPQTPVKVPMGATDTAKVKPKPVKTPQAPPTSTVIMTKARYDSILNESQATRDTLNAMLKNVKMKTYRDALGSRIDMTYCPECYLYGFSEPFEMDYQPPPRIIDSVKTTEQYEIPKSSLSFGVFGESGIVYSYTTKQSTFTGSLGIRIKSQPLEYDLVPAHLDSRTQGFQSRATVRYFIFGN